MKVIRWTGEALEACQNSVAGILRGRAIGGGVRVDDDLNGLIWLREPVPPREDVLGTAWRGRIGAEAQVWDLENPARRVREAYRPLVERFVALHAR